MMIEALSAYLLLAIADLFAPGTQPKCRIAL
jgi:hypothetical protein